ncbi:MAG TPA: tail fiber protein [Thermoanaerobaculia bacterium]
MADPFVAEIRIFPFNFPPKGWAFCNGQLLPLSQNTALFSLLGTVYGGDGKSTFALPDLEGSAAMHPGQGQGLSLRDLGQIGGAQNVTLLISEIPFHTHNLMAFESFDADQFGPNPNGLSMLAKSFNGNAYADPGAITQMAPQALAPAGGSLPHNNMQPYLALNFCIAMQGVFPPRQ